MKEKNHFSLATTIGFLVGVATCVGVGVGAPEISPGYVILIGSGAFTGTYCASLFTTCCIIPYCHERNTNKNLVKKKYSLDSSKTQKTTVMDPSIAPPEIVVIEKINPREAWKTPESETLTPEKNSSTTANTAESELIARALFRSEFNLNLRGKTNEELQDVVRQNRKETWQLPATKYANQDYSSDSDNGNGRPASITKTDSHHGLHSRKIATNVRN